MAQTEKKQGIVIGPEKLAVEAGERVMAAGGNAVDGAVAAGLVACIEQPYMCGVAGYGGVMVVALPGKEPVAVDFDTKAPFELHRDIVMPVEASQQSRYSRWRHSPGLVRPGFTGTGILSIGVPGTLAGLETAARNWGTMPFSDLLQPAIELCEKGMEVRQHLQSCLAVYCRRLTAAPGGAGFYYPDGKPPVLGSTLRNPELAAVLRTVAKNGVDAFYRGPIAAEIVDFVRRNNGILCAEDMASYHPQILKPLQIDYHGCTIHISPPPSGGISSLEALLVSDAAQRIVNAEAWSPTEAHMLLETLREIWSDRFRLIGDPEFVDVPIRMLLSSEHADELSQRVAKRVRDGVVGKTIYPSYDPGGTEHICASDSNGGVVALTQTHGGLFGSMVSIPKLGFVMSGGMSLFSTNPNQANSAEPGKRPLNNMCPAIVTSPGKAPAGVSSAGGRMIVTAVFQVLRNYLYRKLPLVDAIEASRMHYIGSGRVSFNQATPEVLEYFKKLGLRTDKARAFVCGIDPNAPPGRQARTVSGTNRNGE